MNLFSADPFLKALSRAAFDGKEVSTRLFRVRGRTFRLLVVDGEPISRWPFLDFHEEWEGAGAAEAELGYLPRASVTTIPVEQWQPVSPESEVLPSPTIRWGAFPTHEAFVARVGTRNSNLYADSRRRLRKLERDLGPVQFTLHDTAPDVLDTCVDWKSKQYRETGLRDLFADPRNRRLFEELSREGVAAFSTLRAGGRLIAVHLGAIHDGRMYWWVPAYDPELARYSPGRLMLHAMLEASHVAGHSEFDFLIGDEGYKWFYATDVRVVAPFGEPPLRLRARTAAKNSLKGAIKKWPWLWEQAQSLKSRVRSS